MEMMSDDYYKAFRKAHFNLMRYVNYYFSDIQFHF